VKALPALKGLLTDRETPAVRQAACNTLARLGKPALPALASGLKSSDPDLRWQASHAIARIGGNEAVEVYVEALKDPSAEVRRVAVGALGSLGLSDKLIVLTLAEAVKDKDDQVRTQAADSLLRLGPAAREAIPALKEMLKDADPMVRQRAQELLRMVEIKP
jgi:HEAT repeat protein